MDLGSVYREFEKGSTPVQRTVRDDSGRIMSIITRSQRGDVIVSEHIKDKLYKAMRVMPKDQRRSSAMQDMVKSPTNNYNEDFEYCQYQLLSFNCEQLRKENAPFTHSLIHEKCNWNSKQATKLNTARSARSLQDAWDRYP